MSHIYRLVFVLDVSPSMACVSARGPVLFDELLSTFESILHQIVQPFTLPGSPQVVFTPNVHISVLAQTAPLAQAREKEKRKEGDDDHSSPLHAN